MTAETATARHAAAKKPDGATRPRVRIFDALRGLSVISMVAFHYCYDLKFIEGLNLAWFAPPFQDIWRASISWTFLFIAGCMCSFSRNNLKRSAKYLLVALLIFIVTTVAAVDDPINFGIIFCMGACTLICGLLEKAHVAPRGPVAALVFLALFLLSLGVPNGVFGIGSHVVALPAALYGTPWFSWLGFPDAAFVSGDYYPVIPFILMYLVGDSCGRWWKQTGYPSWCSTLRIPPLEFVGRHALAVYIIHQPVLLLLTGII